MSYPADADEYRQEQIEALLTQPVPDPFGRLAVVGNGLDLSVGVPSAYRGFKAFVKHHITLASGEIDAELAEIYDQVDKIAGPDWQDFEAGLAQLGLPSDVADLEYADEGDLGELEGLMHAGSDYADTFRTRLNDYFTDWIHTLPGADPSKTPTGVRRLIDEADGIIVFNYTRTLEDTFGVPAAKVLHVHGVVDGSSQLYFGCPRPDTPPDGGGTYSVSHEARTAALGDLIVGLTKAPRVDLLVDFMRNCTRLSAVGSFGFSFGEADHDYVSAVIRYCGPATVWTAYCHTAHDADGARDVLDLLGFPGRIDIS